MSTKDGGPAYPCQPLERDGMPSAAMEPGMSIRDHFAGLAMQGLIALDAQLTIQVQCEEAYRYADSMLRARETGQ